MNTVALIPARYASTRFPGKPLAKLAGKEVILHVCTQVAKACITPVVATDDSRIYDCVTKNGYKAVITDANHKSGTDRICEALDKIDSNPDVIINVQGDEPFIQPEQLKKLEAVFSDSNVMIATLIKEFNPDEGFDNLFSPNLVKVTWQSNGDALYFSRSIIPFVRGIDHTKWLEKSKFYTHIGVYGYRPEILRQIAALPQSELEKAESLEQLRWLDAGYNIRTIVTDGFGVGIDTPEDLAKAEKLISSRL